MRIKQAYVSSAITFFEPSFREKYKLEPYHDLEAPAVFYGVYGARDRLWLNSHKGLAVVLYGGSDAMRIEGNVDLLKKPNIRHIARGKFIEHDLQQFGIKYKSVPVSPFTRSANPLPKGNAVYAYLPEGKEDFYGKFIIDTLNLPYELIIGGSGRFSRYAMSEVYSRCFIGLRLTPHDGLPNTVIEMALLGIPCVYNGGLPGSLPWNNTADIRRHISNEARNIGLVNTTLAEETERFLNTNQEEWLHTEFYEK